VLTTLLLLAAVGSIVGALLAVAVDYWRSRSARLTADLAALDAQVVAEREQAADVTRYGTIGHPGGPR
jgi:hypothetical protein